MTIRGWLDSETDCCLRKGKNPANILKMINVQ